MNPLIGITTRPTDAEDRYALSAEYVQAIRRAGGIAVLIPPGERSPGDVYARLDGLILSGGGDIDVALYGGSPHAEIYGVSAERDQQEIDLARIAANGTKPCMPICRGVQVLNVALGGTLIEHLPDEVGEKVIHRDPMKKVGMEHPVTVTPGSLLHRLVGDKCSVMSWHHQALRKVADRLEVTAKADDGIIEAVELRDHPWFLGLQWHPEMSAARDPVQQNLFDAFVGACRMWAVANKA
ncbi:MAG: gamma-glutamyl-gamma-aminobutyrate hydrolase family protein [Leptospirales bacterium]|nr:gamma-glutamyl-gamma-aminobutyrate hydrolase family protein [Leptospirales bacterium]